MRKPTNCIYELEKEHLRRQNAFLQKEVEDATDKSRHLGADNQDIRGRIKSADMIKIVTRAIEKYTKEQ